MSFRVNQLLTDPCLANDSNTVLTLLSSCCLGIKVSVEGPKVKNLSLNFEGLQSHRLLSLALSAISTMSHGDGSHPTPRSGWVLGTVPLARGTIICTPLCLVGSHAARFRERSFIRLIVNQGQRERPA